MKKSYLRVKTDTSALSKTRLNNNKAIYNQFLFSVENLQLNHIQRHVCDRNKNR